LIAVVEEFVSLLSKMLGARLAGEYVPVAEVAPYAKLRQYK
jgi:hypothetical protein